MREVFQWENIKWNLIVTIAIVGIIGGIILYSNRGDFLVYWPWFLVAVVVFMFWMLASEVLGRWRHRSIIIGRRLHWLTELGFTVENIGDYWGYKGTYHSYFIRVYYNWESILYKREHELCMMVYFEPPLLHNGELNVPLLNQANAAVRPAFWESQNCLLKYEASYLANHTPITPFTSPRRMRKRLDHALTAVVERKLMPISESAVHELVNNDPWLHGPSIDYFQMAYGATE